MIVVKYKEYREQYALIGAGYGMYKAQGQPGWGRIANTTQGTTKAVALCNKDGEIIWAKSEDVTVISIDGVLVSERLK